MPKTLTELLTVADLVFNETQPGANTHVRVGGWMKDLIETLQAPLQVSVPFSGITVTALGVSEQLQIDFNCPQWRPSFTIELYASEPIGFSGPVPDFTDFIFMQSQAYPQPPANDINFSPLTEWEAAFGPIGDFIGSVAIFLLVQRDELGRATFSNMIGGTIQNS